MASSSTPTSSTSITPLQVIPLFSILSLLVTTTNLNTATTVVTTESTVTSTIATTSTAHPTPQSFKTESNFQKMMWEYSNEAKFPHANTPSQITKNELITIREHYHIPSTHKLKAPSATDRMYHRTDGWTAMPLTLLEKRVRLPLHAFVSTLLRFISIGFTQLVPNSYINTIAFIAFCHEADIPPAIDFFLTLFKLNKSREYSFKQQGMTQKTSSSSKDQKLKES